LTSFIKYNITPDGVVLLSKDSYLSYYADPQDYPTHDEIKTWLIQDRGFSTIFEVSGFSEANSNQTTSLPVRIIHVPIGNGQPTIKYLEVTTFPDGNEVGRIYL
jgi:hypothetical protein